ncbi:MAG: GNAT family N-acetyltransferase [Planctomycetota bacterium]
MISIESFRPEEWAAYKVLRLRALLDTPDAFGMLHSEEAEQPDGYWLARVSNVEVAHFVARGPEGDVGLSVGAPYRGREGCAGLFGMWVAPEARGRGVGKRLVQSVIDWARTQGYERILLDVGDENQAAIALYQSMGFVPSGIRGTLPPPREHIPEHERVLEL